MVLNRTMLEHLLLIELYIYFSLLINILKNSSSTNLIHSIAFHIMCHMNADYNAFRAQ